MFQLIFRRGPLMMDEREWYHAQAAECSVLAEKATDPPIRDKGVQTGEADRWL
jgi:hypothetical protein